MAGERIQSQQSNIPTANSGNTADRTEAYSDRAAEAMYLRRFNESLKIEEAKNDVSAERLKLLMEESDKFDEQIKNSKSVLAQIKAQLKAKEELTEEDKIQLKIAREHLNDLEVGQQKVKNAVEAVTEAIGIERAQTAATAKSIEDREKAHQNLVKSYKQEKEELDKIIESGNEFEAGAARIKLEKLDTKIAEDNSLSKEDKQEIYGKPEQLKDGTGFLTAFMNSMQGQEGRFSSLLKETVGAPVSGLAKTATAICDAVLAMRNALNKVVDSTASFLENVYGAINANLEGTNKSYNSIANDMKEAIGLSGVIKQTEYLNTIKNLTSQGLNREVEQMATLDILKDRTLTTFDTLDANLIRIQKLQTFGTNNTTALMFGVENVIKNRFNELYQDTTYLSSLYDAVTGMVTDALSEVKNNGDAVSLYSAIQSWMGTLYEAGVSSGTVDKLAQGINYLGSGNISALSGSKDVENLILLAMDKAGMDFADTLQQGLSANDVNTLFSTLTDYLKDVYTSTTENNVLTSAYTNLFGMSVSDIKAISNITNSGALNVTNSGALNVTTGKALKAAEDELQLAASTQRTLLSERLNNFTDNAQFDFGEQIASSTGAYATYKVSNMLLDAYDSITANAAKDKNGNVKGVLGKIAKPIQWAGTLGYLGTVGYGALGLAQAIPGALKNIADDNYSSILDLAGLGKTTGASSKGSGGLAGIEGLLKNSMGTYESGNTDDGNGGTKFSSAYTTASGEVIDMSDWENEDTEDESTKILKELENTLMQCTTNDGESKYAIAVSLQGMSNDVLRSFASIFADENAMGDTFDGKNNVLKDALFNYADDGTTTTKNKK